MKSHASFSLHGLAIAAALSVNQWGCRSEQARPNMIGSGIETREAVPKSPQTTGTTKEQGVTLKQKIYTSDKGVTGKQTLRNVLSSLLGPARPKNFGAELLAAQRLAGIKWVRRAPDPPFTLHNLLFAIEGRALLRLDPGTGKTIWRFSPVGMMVKGRPRIFGSWLLTMSEPISPINKISARIFRLDPETGDVKAIVKLPAGYTATGFFKSRDDGICVGLSRPCCGKAGAMELEDDLLDLPSPPDTCDRKPHETGKKPDHDRLRKSMLSIFEECSAAQKRPGYKKSLALSPLIFRKIVIIKKESLALACTEHGTYLMKLPACNVLCRLPLRSRILAVLGKIAIMRAGTGTFGLDLELAKTRCINNKNIIKGWIKIRADSKRKIPVFGEPRWSSEPVAYLDRTVTVPFDAFSENKRLGVPFYRLMLEPPDLFMPRPVRWLWGGHGVLFDPETSLNSSH
ncbi:MAG: hypothetical protein GXP49_18135 [Deltaproteobacteria bacterium]|nr:hypothetical protein [Deltaproteobacteria bacterium]